MKQTYISLLSFTLFFTLLFVGSSSIIFAQDATNTGDVRGFVYDKTSGEPIIFTNVYLEGTTYGAATNIDGFYAISKVPAGKYTLACSYIGYDTTRIAISLDPGRIVNQKIYLEQGDIELGVIEVQASREEKRTETKVSTIKITGKELGKIPAIGGEPDLAQYLQVLPGVVFTGDQGGQLYIRGGSQIQTKVLLDGMTVYNPFHSIGLFSVFETDIIRNVEVMTGGFNAEYGGRISAVIDVTTRDGNKNKMAGKIATNTFLSKATIEGPIIKLNTENDNAINGSYIFTAKTSYLDRTSPVLYNYIDTAGLPYNFTDFYGKTAFNLGNGSKISFSGYKNTDNANFRGSSDFQWNAWGMGSNFVIVPGQSRAILGGHFSFSSYDIALQEADSKPRTSSIGGFEGGVDFSYFLPKGDIKYGIELRGFSTTFEFFNPLNFKIEENQFTTEIGGFFKYKTTLDKLLIEPSLRVNYYASLSQFTFEPRLGMKYNASDNFRLKLATGFYTQNFISTKSDRDVVNLFTGFLSAPENLKDETGQNSANKLQSSFHAVTGVEVDLTQNLEFNGEVYYKDFGQLININRNKLFASDPDYIVEQGDAYGFDAVLKYDDRNWYLWAVYSLAFTNRDDGRQIYPPHFDRRHNVNLVATRLFGSDRSWELSGRWNLGSGFPFTQTQGFYESVDFLGGVDVNFLEQNGDLGVIYADELNGGRLPYYHRLDISLKKTWKFSETNRLEASASVTNVYDRENIFYFDRVRYDRLNQLPILPSAGLSFTF